jgi:hypothetical protein
MARPALAALQLCALIAVGRASPSGCGGVRFVRINNDAGAASMNFDEVQVWTPWGFNAVRARCGAARARALWGYCCAPPGARLTRA